MTFVTPTYGTSIVTPARENAAGIYLPFNALDVEIASYANVELWVDGKSLEALNPVRGTDRIGGLKVQSNSVATSPSIMPSTPDFDGPGYQFLSGDQQALHVPDYTIPSTYWWNCVTSMSGVAGVLGLFGHSDGTGNRVRTWLSLGGTGDFDFRTNHAGSGPGNDAHIPDEDTGISPNTRYVLWGCYDELTGQTTIGRGRDVLGGGTITIQHKAATGLTIGGTGSATQTCTGQIDAFLMGSAAFYDPYETAPVNKNRNRLIDLIAARYNVAV
ncbi:hypothetical protein [uncultured Tateyamaria sp.]|uniref:hypothetical protein n=1 Tax=uncultured Tateyamaria sp. TaxID=455651 RepID=UPI00261EAE93|nr:hypothetical protein [uncultured Tateyamaria sp.]